VREGGIEGQKKRDKKGGRERERLFHYKCDLKKH